MRVCTSNQADDPLLHFPSRFVCKGERQDMERIDPILQQVSYPVCEYTRLPRAGSGNNHYGTLSGHYGRLLSLV